MNEDENIVIYLTHWDFMKKIEEFEKHSSYIKSTGIFRGKLELKFYTQTGTVTYRYRPATKLEKALK